MRRWRVKLTVISVLGAGLVWWLLARDAQPSYEGRTLESWVADIGINSADNPDQTLRTYEDSERARRAIRAIGTNAVPHLIGWAEYRTASWKRVVYPIANKVFSALSMRFRLWDKEDLRAMRAATMLGEVATPSPRLMRIADNLCAATDANVSLRGPQILFGLARRHDEALLACLTNKWTSPRAFAVRTLPQLKTNATAITAMLAGALRDTDAVVVIAAAETLGRFKKDPATAIAALTQALNDARPSVRNRAALALGNYGKAAASALPALRNAENDPDTNVVSIARRAIRRIEDNQRASK